MGVQMQIIKDYMVQAKEFRTKHLDLSDPCDVRGGGSKEFKGLLAYYLNTEIPTERYIMLCHACNNGACSNVKHLYWGNHKENYQDYVDNGGKSFHQKMIDKYGIEETNKIRCAGLLKSRGHSAYTQEQIDNYRKIISTIEQKHGWVTKAALALNISHTQVRRFCQKHMSERN